MISNDGLRVMGMVYLRDVRGIRSWKRRYMDCDAETKTLRMFSNDQQFQPKASWRVSDILDVQHSQQLKVDKDKGFHFNIVFVGEKVWKLKTLNRDERDAWVAFLSNMVSELRSEKATDREVTEVVSYLAGLSTEQMRFTLDLSTFLAMPNVAQILKEVRKGNWLHPLYDTILSPPTGATEPLSSTLSSTSPYLPVTTVELRCGDDDVVHGCFYEASQQRLILYLSAGDESNVVSYPDTRTLRALLTAHPWKTTLQTWFSEKHKSRLDIVSNLLGGVPVELEFGLDIVDGDELRRYVEEVLTTEYIDHITRAVTQARDEVLNIVDDKSSVGVALAQNVTHISIRVEAADVAHRQYPHLQVRRRATDKDKAFGFRAALALTAKKSSSQRSTLKRASSYLSSPVFPHSFSAAELQELTFDSLCTKLVDLWYRLCVVSKLLQAEAQLSRFIGDGTDSSVTNVSWDQLGEVLDELTVEDPAGRIATALHICDVYASRLRQLRECEMLGNPLASSVVRSVTLSFAVLNGESPARQLQDSVVVTRSGRLAETIFLRCHRNPSTTVPSPINHNTDDEHSLPLPAVPPYSLAIRVPRAPVTVILGIRELVVFFLGFRRRCDITTSGCPDVEEEDVSEAESDGSQVPTGQDTQRGGVQNLSVAPVRPLVTEASFELDANSMDALLKNMSIAFNRRLTMRDLTSVTKEGLSKLRRLFPSESVTIPRERVAAVVEALIEYQFPEWEKMLKHAVDSSLMAASTSSAVSFAHVAMSALPLILPCDVLQSVANRRDVLLCGLEGVGKTTLINELRGRHEARHFPTVGYRSEIVFAQDLNLRCTEIGGAPEQRERWQYVFKHTPNVDGLIFVLEAHSRATTEARHYLKNILTHKNIAKHGIPVLVLVNFKPSSTELVHAQVTTNASPTEENQVRMLEDTLKLKSLCSEVKAKYKIMPAHIFTAKTAAALLCSTTVGNAASRAPDELRTALSWLVSQLKRPTDRPRRRAAPSSASAAPVQQEQHT